MTSPHPAESSPDRFSVLLSFLCTLLFWGAIYIYMPILTPYARHISGPLQAAGLVMGAYGLSQILLRIPLGVWSDRLRRRKPFLLLGFLFDALANLGLLFSSNARMLFFSVLTAGAAASMWVPFTVLFSSYFPLSQMAHSLSLLIGASRLAQITANYAGGQIAEVWGWTAPFWVGSVLALLGLSLTLGISEVRPQKGPDLSLQGALQVGRNRMLLLTSFLGTLMQSANFSTAYGFTPILAQQLGASKADLGVLLFWYMLPNTASTLLSGTFIRRYLADRSILMIGFLLISGAVLATPSVSHIRPLYLVQGVNGIGVGLLFPILMSLSTQSVPRTQQATAMGFFQSLYAIGMSLGPILSGLLAQRIGLSSVFVLNGAIGLAGAVISWGKVPRASTGEIC
ncbi:MAG: MFS transporter [candidate division NC10 bacterium]|nr:MFS transporter [candidate division NC10 bacterium]